MCFRNEVKTLEMYIAWYAGDPEYQAIDMNCNVVVSLTNVSVNWTTRKWRFSPKKLILNCGVPKKRNMIGLTRPKDVLLTQIKVINDFKGEVFVCPPDIPLPRKIPASINVNEILEQNIKNARAYYEEYQRLSAQFPNIKPIGIIHGYDDKSLLVMTRKLMEIGYQYFALGSQEAKSRLDRGSIASFIETLVKTVGYIHVLGVTSTDLHTQYLPLSLVHSVDSSTPIKEAFTNGIYFSNPIRRFKICTERLNIDWVRHWGYASLVCNPFRGLSCGRVCEGIEENFKNRIVDFRRLPPCDCPVCRKFGQEEGLFHIGKKIYNNRRALHNYFHLKKEFEAILDNPFLERHEAIESIH
jgi:hypothetical protein